MMELHAGYVSGSLMPLIAPHIRQPGAPIALENLCHFVIDQDITPKAGAFPELAILENLIARGTPTLPSLRVEKWLADTTGLMNFEEIGDRAKGTGRYAVKLNQESDAALLKQLACAWCCPAPDATCTESLGFTLPKFDSKAEESFFNGPLRDLLGGSVMQFVERQRPVNTIATGKSFEQQKTDFALDLPGSNGKTRKKGIIFEYDGAHHEEEAHRFNDHNRDVAVEKSGWFPTIRYTDPENQISLASLHKGIAGQLLAHPVIQRIQEAEKAWPTRASLDNQILTFALSPLAIARIQRVIVRLIRSGRLNPNAAKWRILVIERDVPCAQIALDDLRDWLGHLWRLYAPERQAPSFDLTVIQWRDLGRERGTAEAAYDLGLDVSMLLRPGTTYPTEDQAIQTMALPVANWVRIRSTYRQAISHKLESSSRVSSQATEVEERHALEFFLQNIFRKADFRDGQLPIVSRLLRGKSVIGLLPTGSGKSITYQLPALLQNGQVIVIDPIKALMKDQYDGLCRNAIDSAVHIYSSSSRGADERKKKQDALQREEIKFAFVSPERLTSKEFREMLAKMGQKFCFSVIDEAHCVSEWGHEFRTAYLMLGRNLRNHCQSVDGGRLPLAALTGTASFEVLEDIQRELDLANETDPGHIVRPKNGMARSELKFKVIQITPTEEEKSKHTTLKEAVGIAKQNALPKQMDDVAKECGGSGWQELLDPRQRKYLDPERPLAAGLIFCPHREWVYGAQDIAELIRTGQGENAKDSVDSLPFVNCYVGSSDGENPSDMPDDNEKIQHDFSTNKTTLLACTKAFGMGIDKDNIRFTIHTNIPGSPESFYQEAGRAGRDRNEAHCWILYSGAELPPKANDQPAGRPPTVDGELMESFINGSFRGVAHDVGMVFDLLEEIRTTGQPSAADTPMPGVEQKLAYLRSEAIERQIIQIPFTNGYLQELHQILEGLGKKIRLSEIEKAYEYGHKLAEFKKTLVNKTQSWRSGLPEDVDDFVDAHFHHMRRQPDTFRAIHRLVLLGVFQDYTVDYNTKIVSVVLRNVSDDEIKEHLGGYFAQYAHRDSPEHKRYLKTIHDMPDATVLRQCARALIQFVYEKIEKKRRQNLNLMEEITREGLKDPAIFRDRVNTFFDSRYTEDLRKWNDEYSIEDVFSVIHGGLPSQVPANIHPLGFTDLQEIKQLLGSCDRLLLEKPDNGFFHALRAYSLAAVGIYDDSYVFDALSKAKHDLLKDSRDPREEYHRFLARMRRAIGSVNSQGVVITDSLLTKSHREWLQKFNQRLQQETTP